MAASRAGIALLSRTGPTASSRKDPAKDAPRGLCSRWRVRDGIDHRRNVDLDLSADGLRAASTAGSRLRIGGDLGRALDGLRKIYPPAKKLNYLKPGDLLFNWRNCSKHLIGKTALFGLEGEYLFTSFLIGIRPKPQCFDNRFLWYLLNIYRAAGMYQQFMRQNVNDSFNREELKITKFPVPPVGVQEQIVEELEEERELVDANKELIHRLEEKTKQTINRVWVEAE